jgi:hypothetical protein
MAEREVNDGDSKSAALQDAADMSEGGEALTDGMLKATLSSSAIEGSPAYFVQLDSFLVSQSPAALAKLAVISAFPGKWGNGPEFGGKLEDAEFVERLVPCVAQALREVAPSGLQVAAVIALAELSLEHPNAAVGTVVSRPVTEGERTTVSASASSSIGTENGSGSGSGSDSDSSEWTSDLGTIELSKLRTSSLLKFLWSAGRLPEGLVSAQAFEAGSLVLQGRNISIGYNTGRYSSTSAQSTEFMLLARLLFDARRPNGRQDNAFIDAVLRNIIKALRAHLPPPPEERLGEPAAESPDLTDGHSSADFVALSEIIRALVNFRVVSMELVGLCERCVRKELEFHARSADSSSSSCRRLYDVGRLEGFLAVYREVNSKTKGFKLFG